MKNWTEIWRLYHRFEWQERLLSMECKYSEPLDELTASLMHVGKLINIRSWPVETWCILDRNIKSLLTRKLVFCHRLQSLKMAA